MKWVTYIEILSYSGCFHQGANIVGYSKVILKKIFLNFQKHSQEKLYHETQKSCKQYVSSERILTEMIRGIFRTQSNIKDGAFCSPSQIFHLVLNTPRMISRKKIWEILEQLFFRINSNSRGVEHLKWIFLAKILTN